MSEATTRAYLRYAAKTIDQLLNGDRVGPDRATGFVLLAFPIGTEEGRRVNYVSNCHRDDMLAALKEIVARFEGRLVETDTKQ